MSAQVIRFADLRARRRAEIIARRWDRIALAAAVLCSDDLVDRLTDDERLAIAVLAREIDATMADLAAANTWPGGGA